MNRTFDNGNGFHSNNRIARRLLEEELRIRFSERVSDFLKSDKLRRLVKTLSVALCLVGFVGVVGAMEAGSLGLVSGVVLGSILTGIEAFCIRF